MKITPDADGLFDTSFIYDLACPRCGEVERDPNELFVSSSEEAETECGECGCKFHVSKFVEVTYTTTPIEEAEEDD